MRASSIGGVRPLPRLSPSAALLLAVPGVVVAAWGILFGAGGLAPGAANLIALGTTLPAAVVLGLVALGRWPFAMPSRTTLVAAAGLLAFGVIAALSATWSLSPQRSVDQAILAAAYLGALALGVLVGPALPRPGTAFAIGTTALATLSSGWALLARSFTITTGVSLSPRLSGTLTLPNALAVLALVGLFGGLALCAHRDRRLRAVGGAVAAINALALVLTSSRSGLGLALLGTIALLLVLTAAPRMRLVGLVAIVPAIVAGLRIAEWNAFTAFEQSLIPAGWKLLAAAIGVAALGAAIAVVLPRVLPGCDPAGPTGRASRRTLLIAAAGVVVLLLGLVVAAGGPAGTIQAIREGFSGPVGQSGVRVGIGSNLRDHWWATALDGFRERPLIGWGAGSFRILEQISAVPVYVTDSAHNTILEALSGTGLLGGLPFIVGGVALVLMAVDGIRRPRPGDAVGAAVTGIAALAFVLQGLVDVDWSLAAQGVIVYAAIGAIARQPTAAPAPASGAARGVAGGLAVVVLIAGLFALPFWLSARDTVRSNALLADDPAAALDDAARAKALNPLAVDPLLADAEARELLGDEAGATAALRRAIELEPDNYEPWLFYGTYLAFSWGRVEDGRAALERARRLSGDDWSVMTVYDTLPPPNAG